MRSSCNVELARPKKKKEERKKNILAILLLSGSILLRCFSMPLGVLLVMKTLEGGWYVVINAISLPYLRFGEISLYYHILRVHASPTLESTNSMISFPE